MRTAIKSALGVIFLFALSGCAGATIQNLSMSNIQPAKNLKFAKTDFAGENISSQDVVNAVRTAINGGGKYKQVNYRYDPAGNSTVKRNFGFKTSNTEQSVIAEYINGTDWGNRYEEQHYSREIASFGYKISPSGDMYDIVVAFPAQLTMAKGVDPIPISGPSFFCKSEDAMDDLTVKFNNLDNAFIPRDLDLKGEINVEFDNSSVYANYERKIGRYKSLEKTEVSTENSTRPIKKRHYSQNDRTGKEVKMDDMDKKNIFNLKVNDEELPLEINVYPYRNGSKVVYQVTIPYKMTSKASITQTDIDKIKGTIEGIARD